MKRVLLYICIAIVAIDCAKDADVTPSIDNALTITSNITTRVYNEQWEKSDAIGVYMSSSTFGDNGANVEYTTADGSGNFVSTTPLYYPASGVVDIFAYYPYVASVDLSTYPINSVDQIDLLSVKKSGVAKSSSAVDLTFEHLLSMISLTIIAGDGLEDSDLAGLELKISDISTTATFDVTNSCVNSSSLGAVTEFALSTTETGTSSSAILIPQSLSDVKLYFTTKEYGTFFTAISASEFAVGCKYSYTATINREGVELSAVNIDPWSDNIDSGSANIVDIELKDDIYYINTGAGLEAFADLVNGVVNTTAVTYGGITFSDEAQTGINGVLMRNIDLGDVCGVDVGEGGTNWTPIGYSSSTSFSGSFDGRGYLVDNLYIGSTNQQALFGYIGEDGEVYNFGVSGDIINTTGAWQSAGIAANNYGLVINCYSLVNVSGGTNVGGIAGYNEGSVVNCYNRGSVVGMTNIGGIVGQNASGGYVGYCYSVGDISDDETTSRVGGVVGWNHTTTTEAPTIKGSFCLDNTTYSIGIVEYTTSSGGITGNVCDEEYLTSEVFAIIINNGAWTYNDTYKSTITIPACAWVDNSAKQDYTTLDFGVEPLYNDKVYDIIYNSGIYEIYSADGLEAFAAMVNNTDLPDGVVTSGGDHFVFDEAQTSIDGQLMRDIDLGGIDENGDGISGKEWTPIGSSSMPYSGKFDGVGHLVSGLYVSGSNYAGLLGCTGTDAEISNLGVDGNVSGDGEAGGVVGQNSGTITNCYNASSVNGDMRAGGVAGTNEGTIANCYNIGSISSDVVAGGVVGQNSGTITNCYNTGSVSDEGMGVGGVVGYSNDTLTSCYYLETTVSDSYATSMTTTEMQASDFIIALNNNACTYNEENPDMPQACAWVATDKYPTLDFGVAPTSTDIVYNGDTYEIYSAKGLKAFADLVNGIGNTGGVTVIGADPNFDSTNTSINGRLMSNVDLSTICYEVDGTADGDVSWIAIGGWTRGFNGTFDGDGYTVSGLYLNISSNNQGFFGYVEVQATIKNLGVEGSVIAASAVGAVVGFNYGTVINCYSSGEVIGSGSNGGIIGFNGGTVSCCYSRATVVSSASSLGGVVGQTNNSNITYCYYDATVAGYIGAVNGGDSGTNYCGLTTEQMKGDAATEGTLLYYLTDLSQGNSSAWVADTSGINDGYPIITRQTIND